MSRNDYEAHVIESMARMTSYLASKHVPEGKLGGNNPPVSRIATVLSVDKSFGSGQSVFGRCPKIRVFDEIANRFGC